MHAIEKQKSPVNSMFDIVLGQHSVNFWLQKINPLWSVQQALGKIVQKQQSAADTVSLTIQVNRHFKMGQAGQHHPIIIEIKGIRYERTYSLTQLDHQHVLLTVKKVDQGIVSQWLNDHAKIDDVIEFGVPYGEMLVPKNSQNLILLAAGSGITPMYSLIKQLATTRQLDQQAVHLMYWVKKHEDVAFKQVFDHFSEQFPQFKFEVFYTQEQLADSRLNVEHLNHIENLQDSTVYVCGPSGFVSTAEALFENVQDFKSEAFSLSPVITDDIGFINVTLTQSNKVVAIPKGQSILVGLEQQNIKPQHGCRMGICNKCACNKAQGATKNLVNGSENSEPNNLLRICVNTAQTDLVIDI
ncbi:ferredoxin reductase [Acinetobacter rongchengensis]|uniref:Ferredoxin reductase n=1 Tax=Acinetobacter rongchengensis TaxID=2419601 RepID=A0A3A8ESF8_9GAMM|nr:ferredoxin reductase [Acinetobacter rongchengensis]RKG37787.1 ferredoxin reductase [Acinetobacter rongchengensis]